MILLVLVLVLVLVKRGSDDRAEGSPDGPQEERNPKSGPEFPGTERIPNLLVQWSAILEAERAAYGSNDRTPAGLRRRLWIVALPYTVERFGFDPVAVAAICLHESAYATSYAATHYSNLFGVSYKDPETGKWRPFKYSNLAECWLHFVRVVSGTRYRKAQDMQSDGRVWLRALHECGYNSTDAWLRGVLAAYDQLAGIL